MAHPREHALLATLIETLVVCTDPALRDRVLLEASLISGAATAAGLWRPCATAGGWSRVRAHGPPELLPRDSLVVGVLEGQLDGEVAQDQRILACGRGPGRVALALGGVRAREEEIDRIQGLLVAFAATSVEARPSDRLPAPLPADPQDARGRDRRGLQHDLRNLLHALGSAQNVIDELGDELTPEELVWARERVERESQRVGRLLLDAVEEGTPGETRSPRPGWKPELVIRDVTDGFGRAFRHLGVHLTRLVDEDLPEPGGAIDEVGLRRIAQNLLQNARESLAPSDRDGTGSEPDGSRRRELIVELFASRGVQGGLVLRVEDNGPGIPEEILPRVFDAGVTAGKADGQGVGLAVVRDLVSSAGGEVRARNVPGRGGARFEVWLRSA